jgi:hypothetical protein
MRLAGLALTIFFSTTYSVFAQMNDQEISNLRKHLNISVKDVVRQDKNAKLTDSNSLKVFLAIKRSGNEAKYFEKWVEDWNKKEASDYGKLEIVKDALQADVVLSQFISIQSKLVKDTSIGIGNVPPPGRLKSKVKVKSEVDFQQLKLPVYSYLIKHENDVWTIIYEDVETSVPGEQLSTGPESRLWRSFKTELKAR